MILAALTTTVLGFAAPVEPPPAAPADAPPGALLTVGETHLRVASLRPEPMLLLVAAEGGHPGRALWLAPGAALEADFARGALESLRFELVQPADGGWRSSGALPFPRSGAGELARTWLYPSGVALCATDGGLVAPLLPDASLLPLESRTGVKVRGASGETLPMLAPPFHVPIPEPSENPPSDTPPKLEKRPLPPV